MPHITFRSFLSSKPFRVYGPKGTLFYAHADLLAQSSTVLAKDVKGEMLENGTKTIRIQDVDDDLDDDTVMRFLEFAFRGDYTVPSPEVLQLSTDTAALAEAFVNGQVSAVQDEVDRDDHPRQNSWFDGSGEPSNATSHKPVRIAWDHGLTPKEKRRMEKQMKLDGTWGERVTQEMVDDSAAFPSPELEPILEVIEGWPPSPRVELMDLTLEPDPFGPKTLPNTSRRDLWTDFRAQAHLIEQKPWKPAADNDPREDYTLVFLSHARMYKFSERYDVPKLMALALQKLRLTLSQYTFLQSRASEISSMIRYVYRHTQDYTDGRDKLRTLVLEYTICYIKQLRKDDTFQEVLEEGGAFARDVVWELMDLVR